jgi:hypothetical protein
MGSYGGPYTVIDGLTLAVDAGSTRSYSGSGTTWEDLVGSNNGTLTNGPTFDSGNGGSIVFDGTDDYVPFGNTGLTLKAINILCYFNIEITSTISTIFGPFRYNSGLQDGIALGPASGYLVNETLTMVTRIGTSGQNYQRTAISDNIPSGWNNIVFNWNGSNYDIYLNGDQKTVFSGTSPSGHVSLITSAEFSLGKGDTPSSYFPGKIANTFLYSQSLSNAEIIQNYNAQKSRFGL